MSASTAAEAKTGSAYSYFVAGFLAVVYTLNFLDRQIVAILGKYISQDLHLTKTEFGLLGGTTFAVLYTTCGIPVAYMADRGRRVWIITGACAIWSLFTALCGTATNFVQIALFRMGVGVGEAGGSPPSYSLISDYFPPSQRGVGLAIYSLGVPVGSMLGAFAGGKIALAYGWRTAFYAVGAPGVVLAVLVLALVREPKRGGMDAVLDGGAEHPPPAAIGQSVAAYFTNRTLVLTAVSSALSAFVGYAGLLWNPQFLEHVKHMSDARVTTYYSVVLGVTGVIGTFGAGWLVDRLSHRDRRWFAWVPAIAFAASAPCFIGLLWAPGWQLAMLFLAGSILLNSMYLAPALAVVQNAAQPGQRTMSGAILLFVVNLIGLGVGPVYVGRIAESMDAAHGEMSLAYGYAALVPVMLLTVVAHLATAVSIARDKRMAAMIP
jgi:MFS family permease